MAEKSSKKDKTKDKTKEKPRLINPRIKREIVGVVLLILAAFLLISLISFDADDASFNRVSTSTGRIDVSNWGGVIGAYTADIFLQIVGLCAYIFPLMLIIFAVNLFLSRKLRADFVKAVGFIILLVALAANLGLHFPEEKWFPAGFHNGGVVGYLLADVLKGYLNLIGASIVIIMLLLIGSMLALNLSITTLFGNIFILFKKIFKVLRRIASRINGFILRRREAARRSKKIRAERKIQSKKPPPVVETPKPASKVKKQRVVERQERLRFPGGDGDYQLPPIDILTMPRDEEEFVVDEKSLQMTSNLLVKKLRDFGVDGRVDRVQPGPVITMYEFEPASGVKISKIASLSDDLALNLRALSVRIVAPIPGKNVVGIEIPNNQRQNVYLKEIVSHPDFRTNRSLLTLGLGKDTSGEIVIDDLAKMPHLLVAGATGSGKSVSLNAMIMSILLRARPDDVKFIMIDPKLLEFSHYDGIPHLLLPVVTDAKKAAIALKWAVNEMERRYQLLAKLGARSIDAYNKKVAKELAERKSKSRSLTSTPSPEEEELPRKLPYIVVVIDELADIMMVKSKYVEEGIARLAQMARAAGIHLVIATQRPSVDIITGVIKANFPCRISFQVSSRVDSRTILDSIGAEKLLGAGDMLFLPPDSYKIKRIHGAYISADDIKEVVDYVKDQAKPVYDDSILIDEESETDDEEVDFSDEMYEQAIELVRSTGKPSISYIQRRLRIGYNRAARLMEQMEMDGIVSPQNGTKSREII